MLVSSAVDRKFEPRLGQTKDYNIAISCFSANHVALRNKSDCLRIMIMVIVVSVRQGRIQDFKLGRGEVHLKKIAQSGGRRENFGGKKSRFYAKKSYFFPIWGGGAPSASPPPGSAPVR